jgi:hypothetical protein
VKAPYLSGLSRAATWSLGTALGVRDALWFALGVEALSGALLFTPAILSHRDLPGGSDGVPPARIPAPPRTAARP